MDDMCKIVHNDYDKISDFVYRLSKDWILKMNVVLSYLKCYNFSDWLPTINTL